MQPIIYHPIGYIHSPFPEPGEWNRPSISAASTRAVIVIDERFADGLEGLEGSAHIIILFHFHRSPGCMLKARPHGSPREKGVFATRSPHRPNAIGLTVSRLLKVDGCRLEIEGVDMLDGTPVLDIKPYSPGLCPGVPQSADNW